MAPAWWDGIAACLARLTAALDARDLDAVAEARAQLELAGPERLSRSGLLSGGREVQAAGCWLSARFWWWSTRVRVGRRVRGVENLGVGSCPGREVQAFDHELVEGAGVELECPWAFLTA